ASALPENPQDDAKAPRRFRRGIRNNEQRENLPRYIAVIARKRDQVDVHSIKDQLDGHQHNNHVAPRNDANRPNQQERQTQKQIVPDGHHGVSVLFLAITTAPTMATGTRTLA